MRFVIGSQNDKLSDDGSVIATYSKTGTSCPSSCMFHPTPDMYAIEKRTAFGRATVCYTLKGNTRYHQKSLSTVDALKLRMEVSKFLYLRNVKRAKGATKAKRIKTIRWNVSGDVFNDNVPNVEYIDAIVWACEKLAEVGVQSIGYTHGWHLPELQPLKKWFMASCDTVEETIKAQEAGWMVALVYNAKTDVSGLKLAKCPNQITGGRVKCAKCMLCSPNALPKFTSRVIGLKYH